MKIWNLETKLKIRMFEYKEDIEINIIKENEFCDYFFHENKKSKWKLYKFIKKDVIYHYYNLLGENDIYLLEDEINIDEAVN